MDTRLLEAFRAVMDNGSVTGAARVLGLSQPAVSAQIARLESQVGFKLFERSGSRLRASERGRRFFREVSMALGGIDRLGDVARDIRSGLAETLVVASHPSASTSLIPGVAADLLARRPGTYLRMVNRTSEQVAAIFAAGGADIGVAEWPIRPEDAEVRRYDIGCVAIVPRGHPLAAREVLGLADLSGEPMVAIAETRLIGTRIRAAFGDAGAIYRPVAESEYISTVCMLVAAGCGAAIVDRWSAATFRPLGFEVRLVEPAISYEICVFRRIPKWPAPLVEEFLDLFEARLSAPYPYRPEDKECPP